VTCATSTSLASKIRTILSGPKIKATHRNGSQRSRLRSVTVWPLRLSRTRSRTGSYPSDSQLLPSTGTSRPFSAIFTYAKEREQVVANPVRDVPHFKVTDKLPRWMSDDEEDKLRRVIDKWIRQRPLEHKVTRLLLREHLNEITVGSQTGMRKGNHMRFAGRTSISSAGSRIPWRRSFAPAGLWASTLALEDILRWHA
jgi:hypothetical protein